MKLETMREYGLVDDSTDIVNEGEYVVHAALSHGPWRVWYDREFRGSYPTTRHDERVVVDGPWIEGADDHLHLDPTEDVFETVEAECGTWDYIELAENEVYEPSA